ncbi:phage tail protein [Acetonema longum]|uniref:Tip attachment protein J domain-containing protein n=1 Tax=Acetonema longum DSM 6540 TaxID=1009370 RepID=F7NEB1_9FIRM|nr:phage tail protein [Acetonema longum]EGO65623.1 hypothetical protein ALO_01869 [Acetonema longum DSM 6540]
MSMNPYLGWGLTTLLSHWLNKKEDETSQEPSELSAEAAGLGAPVPVVIGRSIIKNPLIIYYGGFDYKKYTEEYSAHAEFDGWEVIKATAITWALSRVTGWVWPHPHPPNAAPNHAKSQEQLGPTILNALIMWLFNRLINERLLRTTVQKGFKYYLGYQILCCVSGAGLRLRGIYLNEKEAWTGDVSREDYPAGPYIMHVNKDELFGGVDEGGGFVGDIRAYLGGPDQPADPWMAAEMSASSIPQELKGLTPAYRPFVSLVVPVAYIGKQAAIPQTWIDLQWIPNRLGLGGIGDNDANPAEVIYEMHVNNEWGLGKDPELLDVDSLLAVGRTLKDEGRGVSFKITAKAQVRNIIDNLCDHLDMVRYINPQNGKLTFKLIRDDYEADNLPVIDESICSSIDFSRTVWSNSVGEIIAAYSDGAALYETATVMDSDPAVIEANHGDRNSQDLDFTYFTNAANAAWAANRELKQRGFPLASASLICNRKAYTLRPGDPFKLNWKPYGISGLVMRVSDIDIGDFVSGEITVDAVEDVFGAGKTTYGANDTTSWTRPMEYPTGVQVFRYFEAPWELGHSLESYVYALAAQPDNITARWDVWRYKDLSWIKTHGLNLWTPAGQLVGPIALDSAMEDSVGFELIDLGGLFDLARRNVKPGMDLARNGSRLLVINSELMGWGTLTQLANGNWRVSNIIRATHDTVPAGHGAGDIVYFLDPGYYANVTTGGPICPAGETVSEQYNITTATADAEEEFSAAKVRPLTTVRRAERPNPPGRIRLTSHMQAALPRITEATGDLQLAWAVRNKTVAHGCVSQDDITDYYSGQDIEAENGLQTVIRMYSGSALLREEVLSQIPAGDDAVLPKTPTKWTYTWAQRCLDRASFDAETTIVVTAKFNGLESYQNHVRTFFWKPPYIVDACATEQEAQAILSRIYSNGNVVVSFPDTTLNRTIPLTDMPVIVLGTVYDNRYTQMAGENGMPIVVDALALGGILLPSGKWVVPNGTILAIIGANTYDVMTLANGYIALTYFDPDAMGNLAAYQYDGAGFRQIAVPNL